ncbi:hypothetical protein [Denitromonas halophila]|uniref:DUF2335 domain-containing protein n=1 Tax=Denitromonas halophila TaxID=1629404 RepID=A0A557QID3_9RHOO|nr:hypothetical protein [Denitromonas halophila]TVO52662.1 hypothetical protein FHP91_17150 [Denitromonas halophila]
MSDYSESIRLRYKEESTEQLLYLYASTDLTEVAKKLLVSELHSRGVNNIEEQVEPVRAEIVEEREALNASRQEAKKNADFAYKLTYIFVAVLVGGASIYSAIIGDTDKAIVTAVIGALGMLFVWAKRMVWKFIVHLFTS